MTIFLLLGIIFNLIALGCALIILIDAFKDAIWKGLVSIFCCGLYLLYYAFAEFDHPKKWQIIGGWLGGIVLANICYALGGGFPRPGA